MSSNAPVARIIILGASNATRAISTIIGTAQLLVPASRLDVMAAIGHGRSFGVTSRVLARTIPGIIKCDLWHELRDREPAPTYALITDLGNDIMYDQPPLYIMQWVTTCIERLRAHDARIIITGLPIERIMKLSARQYCAARRLLFPGRDITYEQATSRARELHDRLEAAAREYRLPFVTMDPAWYGLDPIHIRMRVWSRAWPAILSAWNDDADTVHPRPSLIRWLRMRTALPADSTWFGRRITRHQPTARLRGGTTVSLY